MTGENRKSEASAAAKGARNGKDYIQRLRDRPIFITHQGQKVDDVTSHPAFRGAVATMANQYDRQWEHPDQNLMASPVSDNRVGRAFMKAKTKDDLQSIGNSLRFWEEGTHGMMGRLPTHLSRAMSGLSAGADFFGETDPAFGRNVDNYFNYLQENDLCMSASLAPPQANRSKSVSEQADPFLAARVKKETDAGVIIRGSRMLSTLPFADEILVYSAAPLRDPEKEMPYAFIFAIPTDTPGLRFIARESVSYSGSHFDHPLGSRFEEMDAAIYFDDVLVPWENFFAYQDFTRCNGAFQYTGSMVHMDHQILVKNIVKTEFLLGLASLLVNCIGAEVFQHMYEKLSDIWINLETMKACLRASEADAELDDWGVMRPAASPISAGCSLFTKCYPRMIEFIQHIGASGLVAMPTEQDVNGPLAAEIQNSFQAARADAYDRISLFRLAWDTTLSAFGSRQVIYERYCRGDPIRHSNAIVLSNQKQIKSYAERVLSFVQEGQEETYSAAAD